MPPRPPCAGLWNTPMVHVSGVLTTCCLDLKLENALGNLREASLEALWSGPTLRRWRLAQIEGRFEDSGPYCTRCNWQSAGFYPPEKAEAWRAAVEAEGGNPSREAETGKAGCGGGG